MGTDISIFCITLYGGVNIKACARFHGNDSCPCMADAPYNLKLIIKRFCFGDVL